MAEGIPIQKLPRPAFQAQPSEGALYHFAKWLMIVILLTRASLDRLLNSLGFSFFGVPFGALINLIVIASVGLLCVLTYPRWRGAVGPWWTLFLLMAIFSISYTPEKGDAIRLIGSLATNIAMIALPFTIVRSEDDILPLLKVVLVSSIVPLLLAIPGLAEERVQSTFTHPNIFAFYICVIILCGLTLLTSPTTARSVRWRNIVILGLLGLAAFMLIMTKTRGAWFGLAAALCLYSVSHDRRFLVLIALSPLLMFVPAIQERLSDINTPTEFVGEGIIVNSYAWRQLLWEGAYGWFLESPFVGYGLDSFLTFSPQFFVWEPDGVYPHNVYVQTSFELGLIGLFFFVMIFLRLALIVWSGRSVARQPSVLLACLIIFYLLICYSDNILYYLSFNWYYWFMVGVLCCWIRIRRLAVPAAAA